MQSHSDDLLLDTSQEQPQPQMVTIQVDPVKLALVNGRRNGASWLTTVGLFALVNSALVFLNINLKFIFGLGFSEVVTVVAQQSGESAYQMVAIGVAVGAALFFHFLGNKARKGASWAFLAGMIFYALDGMLWVLAEQWVEVACHGFAVYMMFKGLQANITFKKQYPEG